LQAANGVEVQIDLSSLSPDHSVKLVSKSQAEVVATSPAPSGSTEGSEGVVLMINPPIDIDLSFTVTDVGRRRVDTNYRAHWLNKKSNVWEPVCLDHTVDSTSTRVSVQVSSSVQSGSSFNPTEGCDPVLSCDGSGGTVLFFSVREDGCDSTGDSMRTEARVMTAVVAAGAIVAMAWMV